MGKASVPALSKDQNHWEQRAKEARALAEHIADPVAKRAMLEIAASYEKIAKRAEARDARIPTPPEH
jgi:hypothetical protein